LAPQALAEQVAVLQADSEEAVAVVFGWRQVVNHEGKALMRRGLAGAAAGRVSASDLVRRCVRSGTNLMGEPGNGLMRLSLAKRLARYDARYPYLVDLDFWFRALMHGDGHYTNTASSSFRISKASWSFAIGKRQFADWKGFITDSEAVKTRGVSRADMTLGLLRARFNMFARLLVYKFIR
jgi:hypothetical protein